MLSIDVTPSAGSSFKDSVIEAMDLAAVLLIMVNLPFNGEKATIYPDGRVWIGREMFTRKEVDSWSASTETNVLLRAEAFSRILNEKFRATKEPGEIMETSILTREQT